MTTAEELLARTADPATEPHIVIGKDRFIVVPPELRTIAVQFDHNIETVTFDCPRYWDNVDMSKMKVYINYKRSDNFRGSYHATDVVIDETDTNIMHFTWTISRNVTGAIGTLTILVCIKKVDDDGNEEVHWNSERNADMKVSEGLECEDAVVDEYPDIITYILTLIGKTGDFAPVATVKEVEGGVQFTVTDKNGVTTAFIKDGYTPVAGKDYFTADDIESIANVVLSKIPVYDGSVTKGVVQ